MNRGTDILHRVARANPVPAAHSAEYDDVIAESMLARISATPRPPASVKPVEDRRLRLQLRAVAIAAGALLAVFVPAVAAAIHYGLFDLSNPGQPIERSQLDLNDISALDESGFTNDVRRLSERAGVAFYIGRSRSGGLCFATGSAAEPAPKLNYFVGCQRPSPSAFPSPEQPILDLSPLKSSNPRVAVYVQRLTGFAADGVARVGFVDTEGAVHSTPVLGNVYATDWFTNDVAATAIVALDKDGKVLYKNGLLLPGQKARIGAQR